MRDALADVAAEAHRVAKPAAGDIVIDTGCNDGTLLRSYPKTGLRLVGFEPAENLVEDARKGTDWVFNDFFRAGIFGEKFGREKAKIITSVAMFYDLEDPNGFVTDIVKCLSSDGVWVVQQNYLTTMLQKNGFDNIGHRRDVLRSRKSQCVCDGYSEVLVFRRGLGGPTKLSDNNVAEERFRQYWSRTPRILFAEHDGEAPCEAWA